MKSRRCCTLWAPAPRSEVPAERPERRNGERVHSGDTVRASRAHGAQFDPLCGWCSYSHIFVSSPMQPREGHLLIGRASSWAAGDAAHAAARNAFRDGSAAVPAHAPAGEDASHLALSGFPGIPPLTSEVLAEAMDTLQSCLRSPPSNGSMDGFAIEPTPVPSLGASKAAAPALMQPDSAVLAEELRKEGVRLVKVGQPAAAELVYSEAIKVAPHTPMLFFNRAACYARLGRHADALADARMGIQLAPTVPRGHWQEALALEAQGRYDEALGAYERACTAARDSHADEATLREYESRRDALLRTAMGQKDAAARVARVLKDAENGKNTRGMLPEARRAAAVLREGP